MRRMRAKNHSSLHVIFWSFPPLPEAYIPYCMAGCIRQMIVVMTLLGSALGARGSSAHHSSPTRPRVGIRRFDGRGYSKEQCQTLTIRLQDELFRRGTVEVVEQAEMDAVMTEHGLGQAGCTDMTCFVEIGRTIGVHQMLFPAISSVGRLTTLTAKLVDVETGRTVKAASVDSRRSFAGLIARDLPELVERISGGADASKAVYTFDPTTERKPVAVLSIRGYGIEQTEAAGLTNRLRTELFNTGVFDVMEREQMEEILREQGMQQSGICSEEDCLVEVGQLIGVRYMIGGAVSRIGSMYSVSSRLIEVQTGKITRSATADVKGDLERVLKETMNDMARAISGLSVRRRTNYPALAWAATAALLAGTGGYFTWSGYKRYDSYRSEQYDLGKLSRDRHLVRRDLMIAYGFYGAAGIAGGLSLYKLISGKVKLRVDQRGSPAPSAGLSVSVEVGR
jgi:TolB-like protein